jgi:hypothetical protein
MHIFPIRAKVQAPGQPRQANNLEGLGAGTRLKKHLGVPRCFRVRY